MALSAEQLYKGIIEALTNVTTHLIINKLFYVVRFEAEHQMEPEQGKK